MQDREEQRDQVGLSASGMGGPCPWPIPALSTYGGSEVPPLGTPQSSQPSSYMGAFDSPLVPWGVLTLLCVEAAAGHRVQWLSCSPIKALVLSSSAGSAEGLEGISLLQRRMTRMMKERRGRRSKGEETGCETEQLTGEVAGQLDLGTVKALLSSSVLTPRCGRSLV